MRVLIVEDDQFYSQRIKEILQDEGLDTLSVSTAEEAISSDPTSYDAAIIDVMLPNDPAASGITEEESRAGFMTGVSVARRLLQKNDKLRIVFLSSGLTGDESEIWASQRMIPFISKSDGRGALLQALSKLNLFSKKRSPRAFIVHGHDDKTVLELKNFIQNSLKWNEPIVLREQPSLGKSIIEKFEDLSGRVDCVFVLLTPDDIAITMATNDQKRRSRQNVIFELGFFYSAFGRQSGRVLLLHKGPVEIPSDLSGIIWIDISNGVNSVGEEIRKEVEYFA
ncbi:MAG TPA: TIR domain-containing protein [Candidatus Angelobacter sp.]|nr:TIR domain-containing protein [Candidatus Angelobacter sp.]